MFITLADLSAYACRLMKALRYEGDGDIKAVNVCIDALLWVGNAPKKTKTVDEFLKEAQLRGCCRKLPSVPGWAKFGKTKVFLAHRDKHKVPSRGSLFGYFVLHRVEIITRNEVAQSLSEIQDSKIPWPRNVKDYVTHIKKWKEKGYPRQEIERRLKEMLQKSYPIDLASGKTSEELGSTELEDIMKLIDRSTKKLIERLIRKLIEKWLRRDNGGSFPPDDSTKGEGPRLCSKRKGPGSVYAVDALCAAVHDTHRQLLRQYLSAESKKSGKNEQEILRRIQQENSPQRWRGWLKYKRNHKWNVQDLLERYKGPFYEAVKLHFRPDRRPKYPIDPRLRSKASNYGELIVFKKPFPILEKAPQAAFRGIGRIDGDKLIDQIARHMGKKALVPTIYFCKAKKPPGRPPQMIVTKEELATWLAQELHVSKACATRLLDKVSLKTREQLQRFQKFKLPGIGTIRLQGKKTRKKIKFFPAKAIRSIESRKK